MVLVGVTTLFVSACGGSSDTATSVAVAASEVTSTVPESTAPTTAPPSSEVTTSTTEATPIPTAPLTGLPVDDVTTLDRPALLVKIDNAPGAWPQTGINQADIVYEENVEGWTRMAAVFHSQGSDPVGPIRSGRTQDISLGTSLDRPLLVWSGGNATTTRLINRSELVNMSVSAAGPNGGYYRSSDKRAPHNLYTKTSNIWSLDEGRGGRPPAQFSYGDVAERGDAVTGVKLRMDGGMRASWEYDGSSGTFLRSRDDDPHVLSDGARISTHNVVVLECEYRTSVADSRSPEAQTTGSGSAWVYTAGHMIEGTWSRADETSPWTLVSSSGDPILLQPGRTWVELIRSGQAVSVPSGTSIDDVAWP